MSNVKTEPMQEVYPKSVRYSPRVRIVKSNDVSGSDTIDISLGEITRRAMIHEDYAVKGLTYDRIARTRGLTIRQVQYACEWIKNNRQYLIDEDKKVAWLVRINARIQELNGIIARLETGEVLTVWGKTVTNPQTNEPIIRYDENAMIKYMVERREYDEMRMIVQGIMQKTNAFFTKEVRVENKVENKPEPHISIYNKMTEEDKITYVNLLKKYTGKDTNTPE